ncbi:MAG: diphosphomevalonate decarboxylase [Piptocephalis tieghemiana]|nr:MAG: diphosphomevalonate decarboxylase [Piptocephalis tieghemiana]
MSTATCTAPVNIAVVKYWGKRSTELNLPTNSSLSVTLSQDHMCSRTTASCSPSYTDGDRLWLNGQEETTVSSRLQAVFQACRALRRKLEEESGSEVEPLSTYGIRIVSSNNFPTAAGLASSASGYAAMVAALAQMYQLPTDPSSLSVIARQGSGSACRSLFGGYVAWDLGSREDGQDSRARQVAPAAHWPEMEAVICVVSAKRKSMPSTRGMQETVATSRLMKERIALVPGCMEKMEEAIRQRDFPTFAELTMRESNQFHAVCLDTFPPIRYLTDTSYSLIQLVHSFNSNGPRAAYTFDAGPNAVIYTLKEHVPELIRLIGSQFPAANDTPLFEDSNAILTPGEDISSAADPSVPRGLLTKLIHTRVGEGPVTVEVGPTPGPASLIDASGLPK